MPTFVKDRNGCWQKKTARLVVAKHQLTWHFFDIAVRTIIEKPGAGESLDLRLRTCSRWAVRMRNGAAFVQYRGASDSTVAMTIRRELETPRGRITDSGPPGHFPMLTRSSCVTPWDERPKAHSTQRA